MKRHLLRLSAFCLMLMTSLVTMAGENDLTWDYSETAPSSNPDNGLYYESKVNDAAGTNNGLKGIKLNSTGYAFFAKAAVAGKLTLTIGKRSGTGDFCVDVFACTIADGKATLGDLIATTDKVQESNPVSVDIPADVTGIYIKRNTPSEGVLSKIVFKEAAPRDFVDFEIPYATLTADGYTGAGLPEGVTFSGTFHDGQHGYSNATLTVPVDGTVKFTISGCQYGGSFPVKNAAGETIATLDQKAAGCYDAGGKVVYIYTGDATTLTLGPVQYLSYFKAEATEVSEVTITYKDQNGNVLGTKTVYEGDAIGEIPYTEADLNLGIGVVFRGWVYSNGIKVKPTDIVNSNITVSAHVTPLEAIPEVGSVQTYDLTKATFYPEDHENFNIEGGYYHDEQHGWAFGNGGKFQVAVGGKAQIVLALCKYSKATATFTVADVQGNVIAENVPGVAETDGTTTIVNYEGSQAGMLTFTYNTDGESYLHSVKVYNVSEFIEKDASGYYIIPAGDAASLLLAINSANNEDGAKIFLPNGTYDLGETVLTSISGNNISIIGQSMKGVTIKNAPPVSMEGLGSADLLLNTSTGLYLQDLTLQNALDYYGAGSAGRAPTLHDKGTKTINKNVRHLSYQDTYYSHKVGGLYYFDGGEMHGTVDYVCGNGKVYFNGVTLVNEQRSTATIAANSELYVFNNCVVENNADEYNFGRAWSDHPVCIYLNTTLKDPARLISSRWNLKGINCDPSIAGEYGTKNVDGVDITPAENTVTFTKENTTMNTILDATALTTYSIENVLGDWAAVAQQECKQIEAPAAKFVNGQVTWDDVEGATAYLMEIPGIGSWIATEKSFSPVGTIVGGTFNPETDMITIRAANARGGFGPAAIVEGTALGINLNKAAEELGIDVIYNLQGVRVNKPTKGIYIINGKKVIIK